MIFLAALDLLTHDELAEHVANLEIMSYGKVMREQVSKVTKTAKNATLQISARLLDSVSRRMEQVSSEHKLSKVADKVGKSADTLSGGARNLDVASDWIPYELREEIKSRIDYYSDKSDNELREALIKRIARLANIKGKEVSDAALIVAAKAMKIDVELKTAEKVEREVFEKYAERLVEQLKVRFARMDKDDLDKLEGLLRDEIARLSKGDAEALAKALGLESISAGNIIRLLKGGGITVGALLAADAAGFGLFLFMATLIKSFSLLIGTTFAFSTYTAAMSGLGFITSPIAACLLNYLYFHCKRHLSKRIYKNKKVVKREAINQRRG